MTDHAPMKLEKLYTCWIERRWHISGGNFHLKVGGAKSSGNAGDPMLGVAVSGGSRIYKRGGGIK